MSKTKTSIKFGLVDVTAKEDSTITVNDKQEFVDLQDLKEEELEEVKYGTCEKNQFALDGSFELMPEELNNMGWWSNEMSDENGSFTIPLVMEIDFTKPHSSLGLTLVFSKARDYCNHLNLKYYDLDGNLISDKDFYPNSFYYVCNNIVENYGKIIITFYSTNNPYRYLKLYRILYGAEKVFEGDNLISANILEEIDLLSSEISINTLDFTVYSEEDEFNIINPQGFYRLLQERQKLEVTETLIKTNEEKEFGTFYLDTWKSEKDKLMTIGAIDLIGVIDKTDFMGGIYKDITFEDLIQQIMSSSKVKEREYEIEEALKNIELTGYIPICTHREALQQAVFAVGAVADCSRSEKIKIYSIKENVNQSVIERTNILQGTKVIEQNEIVTAVEILSHNYVLSETEEEIAKQELDVGDNKILFSEPVANISCTGGTILEYNCNYAIINCTEETEVIVKGYRYIDNLKTHLVQIEKLNSDMKQNTLKIENAFLINKSNAIEIARLVLDYYQDTYKMSFDLILNSESLAEEVEIENDFKQKLIGNINRLDIDLTRWIYCWN